MRKIKLSGLLTVVLALQVSAFDMGSVLKSAAPIVAGSMTQNQTAQNNSLISSLTSSLGVTPTQAIGGTAVLLNSAKGKMEPSQYTELMNKTPGLGDILSSGAASSLLGNTSASDQFKVLGMDPALIKQFAPVILEYAKGYVSPSVASALLGALSF